MTIIYHDDVVQGSPEWYAARCGLLTASEMKLIITPTLKIADNEKTRAHVWELLAQRVNQYVEPSYVSDDMLRGKEEEIYARAEYEKAYAPVQEVGFVTNDKWGFTLGYSPDALVGADGQIECKSRRQKFQMETIVDYARDGSVPSEFMIQVQTGLLVTERLWCDFISYCGGMHMVTIRVLPDPVIQDAILNAAQAFEAKLAEKLEGYQMALRSRLRLIPTERRVEQEMYIGESQ